MPAKKKSKKKTMTKSRKTASSRMAASRKTAKKRPPRKKAAAKGKLARKKLKAPKKRAGEREHVENRVVSASEKSARSGRQSGDLQGLSRRQGADSESVDELLEEGNSFEAGVVTGVEEAGNDNTREVHTREVPVDDVPGEYLDEE
jgi:hypothetical protein